MKDSILILLQLLLKLARISSDDPASKEKLAQKISDHKAHIDTFHGDSDLCDLEIQEAIDDLTTVLTSSTPSADYEEVPDDIDDESPADANQVEGETPTNKLKSTSAAALNKTEEETEETEEPAEKEEEEEESGVETVVEEEKDKKTPKKKAKIKTKKH